MRLFQMCLMTSLPIWKKMEMFTTEQMPEPLPRALSTIRALGRYRGSRIGVEYAEAFILLFEKK